MNNIVNQVAYLRTSRDFPADDSYQLGVQCNKMYIDIANAVNNRTISIFPVNGSAITGESWFLSGGTQRQQVLRQVYTFGTIVPGATLNIPYKINGFTQFTRIYGTCLTSQPDARPIPYASVAANANIDLRVDTTALNIVIANGAASPTLNSGLIILEWMSQV